MALSSYEDDWPHFYQEFPEPDWRGDTSASTSDGTDDFVYLVCEQPKRTRGYCFDCDKPVDVLYYASWAGTNPPPLKCAECGSADCAFLDRVSRRLLEKEGQKAVRRVIRQSLHALGCGK